MSWEAVKRLDRLAPTFGTCLWIRLGMDIAKYNSPLNSTGGILVVLGDQQFKSLGNVVKRLKRLGIHFAHIMQVNLGMDTG